MLKPMEIMSLCIYSGDDTGYEEKDESMSYLNSLSLSKYNIISCHFMNRKKGSPFLVFIFIK